MATGQKRHPDMKADKSGTTGQKYLHNEGFRLAATQEQEEAGGYEVSSKRLRCLARDWHLFRPAPGGGNDLFDVGQSRNPP